MSPDPDSGTIRPQIRSFSEHCVKVPLLKRYFSFLNRIGRAVFIERIPLFLYTFYDERTSISQWNESFHSAQSQ